MSAFEIMKLRHQIEEEESAKKPEINCNSTIPEEPNETTNMITSSIKK